MHYVFGDFSLDTARYELRRAGEVVPLRGKVFDVLAYLVTHHERVVSRDELLEQVWPDQFIAESTLTSCIKAVRQALGDTGRAQYLIKTVHGRGYRCLAPVTPFEHAASEAPPVASVAPRETDGSPDAALPVSESTPEALDALLPSSGDAARLSDVAPQTPVSPAPVHPSENAERRPLTVLVCDLTQAAHLVERLDPEDLRQVMRAYHSTCERVLAQYDGYLAQRLGSRLVAYFGYPYAQEDAAQRAVLTGLGLLEALAAFDVEIAQRQAVTLSIRVGIDSGLVVVEMGEGERAAPLAIGSPQSRAAQLQEAAVPQSVVISSDTLHLVQGWFRCDELSSHVFEGASAPVAIYQVMGRSGVQHRLEMITPGGLTPLVGREHEVGLLSERWQRACEGHGQVVLLSGEAGIGKSRLVQVLKDHAATVPHTRLECRSSPYYQNTALYPITDLLQGIMRWKQDDTAEVKLDKLEEALGEYRLAMEETVPLFAALLSLPIPEDRYLPLKLSPQRQRQKTLEAIVAIIVELSEQQPVLFVLEDLHWTDPTTLELLELLIEQTPAAFLNVLVTCRPEFQPSWSHRSYLTGITVSRLSRDQVERIAQQVAGGKELPAAIIQQLVDKTDGVPLYVEEMTKAALESGALKERSERYELIGSMGSLTIPATLQDSLMARLDRLDAAKAVAQYASVIGRQFSYGLLHAVLDLDDATLRRELGRLVEAELIYQRGAPPQAVYTFKHALIQDTAYESLLRRTRQGYHRQIVEVLEESFPDIAETEPEVLAHHYTCAALYQQAVAYWKQAGDKAAARSAHREAVTCFEQALAALDQLPACRETREQAIDLRLILRGSLHPLGAQRQIMHHLSEAETLALALEDQHRLGQVWARMGHYAWSIGDQERFIELSQQALTTAEACQNTDLQIHAHYYLGAAYHVLGNYSQAIHYLQRVVSSLESDPLWQPVGLRTMLSVTSRAYLAWSLAEMGVFAEAIRIGEEGIQIVETSEKPFTGLVAYVGLGLAYLRKGDLDRATEVLEQGLRWCQSADIPFWLPGLQGALGSVHVVAKRVTSALPLLEQSVAQGPAIRVMIFQPLWISSLAEAYLLGGHVDHALVFGERGLALAQRQKERPHEAYALKLLGDIHAHRGGLDIDQALAYYQQALTLAKALGARPLHAHCHRGLGVLYHQTGQTEQARAELSRAIEMYREMEMTFWLPQTEAVMRSPY